MLSYDMETATFRGTPAEIDDLADRLRPGDFAPVLTRLREQGVEIPADGDDLVAAMSTTLDSSLFTIEIIVSGPGGHHQHVIDAGQNAVGVRRSPLTDELAELSGFPVVNLPGGMTRIVRFRPGTPPALDAEIIEVPADSVVDLGSPQESERRRAWTVVQPLLAEAGYPAEEGSSWQLTQSHARWIATDGAASENTAVHLRVETHYFVLVEESDGIDLVPVPSITAWETMLQVLPGANEIGRSS